MSKIIRNLTLMASAALIVRHFVQLTRVSGNSMFPELHNDDRLLIDKTAYEHKDPEAGDVVVFSEPNTGRMMRSDKKPKPILRLIVSYSL